MRYTLCALWSAHVVWLGEIWMCGLWQHGREAGGNIDVELAATRIYNGLFIPKFAIKKTPSIAFT